MARAEFRVFGQRLIEDVKSKMWNGKTVLSQARQMPVETYFVSRFSSEANVKIRGGLLDVKVRTGETPEGYEIFQPRGQFQFPVRRPDLDAILAYLRVEMPGPQDAWSVEDFIDAARQHQDLVPVEVEKMRWGFTIDGVICEYALVSFNGAMVESVCVESEDHAAMRGVIEGLGLANRPNVNYLTAAKQIVGMYPAR